MPRVILRGALAALAGALLASANTRQIQGVNWAVLGDNFKKVPLVLHGLSDSDSYNTIRAKSDVIYAGFEDNLGIDTVRLPVNTHTVETDWWESYTGVIDSAIDRNLQVILAYWEDAIASGGKINDLEAWNSMWDKVVDQYSNNTLVYFEPMNEPHGYNAGQWTDIAAEWVGRHSSLPKERIVIGGTGYSQDLRPICADSRLDGTLLSFHIYEFFNSATTYEGWAESFRRNVGDEACRARAVATEFGAPMDAGFDYNDAETDENFIHYYRATTDLMREFKMGGTYWPAIGGKITQGQEDDWYAMLKLDGSGTDLTLTTPSESGVERLWHSWGRC